MNFIKASILLIVIGLVAYANAISHPFVHDDLIFIRHNPHIADLKDIPSLFSKAIHAQNSPDIINPYYRPLLEILTRIQYRLFHFNPHGYHFFNILIHVLNGVLVFRLMRYFTHRSLLPWCIAALFLVHPVQTEAVACISGVSNLMYVLLFLSSFWFYIKATARRDPKGYIFYSAALVLYVVSLFVKEQAVALPFVILLYEYCFNNNRKKGEKKGDSALLILKKGAVPFFFLATGGYFLWRKFFLGSALVPLFAYKGELLLRILAIPRTLMMYLRILVFPNDLHYYRSIDILDPPGLAAGAIVFIFAGVFLLMRYLSKEQSRALAFGAGWFLITIFPTLNIIPLVHEYSQIAAFEHFLYLPLAGFILFAFTAGECFIHKYFSKTKTPRIKVAVTSAIILVFLGLTLKQNTYWRGEIPLFERAVKYEKKLGRAHMLLGKAYYFNKDFDRAIREFQVALKIMKGYVGKVTLSQVKEVYLNFIKEIHFDLAHCYTAKKDYNNSISQYRQALAIDPKDGAVHNNIGLNYVRMNDYDKAMKNFRQAIVINPKNLSAMSNLAVCYIKKGERAQAERLLREILVIDSNFISAKRNLEKLLQ